MTKEELIAFEEDIAAEFNAGNIRAPVHLEQGNEDELIKYFAHVERHDWIFGSWRQHYKCLLHGVPPAELKAEIMAGRSISLCFPKYRIVSSAIVGGIIPIALGCAWSIKQAQGSEHVHCFMGDMTSATGIAHECIKYAKHWDLPITFVVEDNDKSVCTDTYKVWNTDHFYTLQWFPTAKVYYYRYTSKWPHAGAGTRVQF